MSRLPIITSKKMERLLFHLGFEKTRQKGSHAFYRHPDERTTTVPHHKGRDLSRPLIREILREINITVEDYQKYLREI